MKLLFLFLLLLSCQAKTPTDNQNSVKSLPVQDSCQVSFEMIPFKKDIISESGYDTIERSFLNDLKWVGVNTETASIFTLSQSSELLDTISLKVFEGVGSGTYFYHEAQDSILVLSLYYEYVDVLYLFKLQNKKLSYLTELVLEVDYEKLQKEGDLRENILPMTSFKICRYGKDKIRCTHPDLTEEKIIQLIE